MQVRTGDKVPEWVQIQRDSEAKQGNWFVLRLNDGYLHVVVFVSCRLGMLINDDDWSPIPLYRMPWETKWDI